MGLVHTIPQTDVTRPTFLKGAPNGQLDHDWLRSPEASTSLHRQMFVPISYAMQAMHLAAADDEVLLRTTGRYRTYDQQVALFRSRFRTEDTGRVPAVTRTWQGQTWWMLPGVALAATPGTSNHGLGLADDIAEQDDADPEVESIDDITLQWLKDNAADFGFALDIHSERWHWHWHRPGHADELTERTVDVLSDHGIIVPDLSRFGFTVPTPPPPPIPPEEDDMTRLLLARLDTNPNQWRRGDGNIATVLRAKEVGHLAALFQQGTPPRYFHPLTGEPLATLTDIPTLNETQLDLWVGYPAYELTITDEG